jgi:hypothetical protein
VALKKGDCRYHGPKYSVALFASISGRSFAIVGASSIATDRPVDLLNDDSNVVRAQSALVMLPRIRVACRSSQSP